MKRFWNWLAFSEYGLLVTIVGVAIVCVTLMAFFPRPKPIVVDVTPHLVTYSYDKYTEVTYINDVYDDELSGLGVDKVYDHDWEETAWSLGTTVEELTIVAFMDHMREQ